MTTAAEVAQWMVDRITAAGEVEHESMVDDITDRFGPEWIGVNANGNPQIKQSVLRAFRRLHANSIEWRNGAWSSLT